MKAPARLHSILSDRAAVNMLKILYDQEYVTRTAHTMPFFRLRQLLGGKLELHQALRLESYGLLSAEKVEDVFIVSLNKKGKEFIEQLDVLKNIVDGTEKKKEQKKIKIEYDLSDLDKKLIVMCYKIQREQGAASMDTLVHELYPKDPSNKKGVVMRYANKLAKLNLLHKNKDGTRVLLGVTEAGQKVIKEQLMESIV